MRKVARLIFISFLVALCCIFTACSTGSVKTYREIKREEIQNYADAKGQSNFSSDDWDAIYELVLWAQKSIGNAGSRAEIDQIVSEAKSAVDEVKPQAYNTGHDGAYFITNESYEAYVRERAAETGKDEKWVQEVLLNGGDGGNGRDHYYVVHPKSSFYCVIADNQIRVSQFGITVYSISQDGNTYQGSWGTSRITFGFNDDILYVQNKVETFLYRKDNAYQRTDTEATAPVAPQEITVYSGEKGHLYVEFWWNYQSYYSSEIAAAEIKQAGSTTYNTGPYLEIVWIGKFIFEFNESQFKTGVNWVRLYHVGGPSITSTKSIIVKKNSDYVLFRVTVAKNGSVKVEKV